MEWGYTWAHVVGSCGSGVGQGIGISLWKVGHWESEGSKKEAANESRARGRRERLGHECGKDVNVENSGRILGGLKKEGESTGRKILSPKKCNR